MIEQTEMKYKQILIEYLKDKINDDTIELLQSILFRKKTYDLLISNEGFFIVENNKMYKLKKCIKDYYKNSNLKNNTVDSKNNENTKTLFVNKIQETKELIHSIPFNHTHVSVDKFIYKLEKQSPLSFCIERINSKNKFIYDYYFTLPYEMDENKMNIKREICLFLSKLT